MVICDMNFVAEVAATPGGEKIYSCIQCGICAGSCPVAGEMEYPPRRVIALIRADRRDEVLANSSMWHCVSCYLCSERCPRDVNPTELAHALEALAVKYGYRVKGTYTPAMYRSFVGSIANNGRVHELGVLLGYYLTTNPLKALKSLTVGWQLFRHRRLPLRAKKVGGRKNLSRIIRKFRQIRGAR